MKLSARIHDNGYAKEKLKSLNILTLATQCLESWPALLGFFFNFRVHFGCHSLF